MLFCLLLFWLSVAAIWYTYLGYPLFMALAARIWAHPWCPADITPSVTIVIAAYNEGQGIVDQVRSMLSSDYPPDRLSVLVITDGSNDASPTALDALAQEDKRVLHTHEPERRGKAHALARATHLARGEVLVFSDANCRFHDDTVRRLVRHFADTSIGAVGGAKRVKSDGSVAAQGEGLYWRYESFLKRCDSTVSSVMGVPGEVWASRRETYVPAETDSIIEDFVASLRIVQAGWRVVYEPEAVALEPPSPSLRAEWGRRTRMAAGGWQSFFRLRGLLRHPNRWIPFQYLSHRMLRWLVTPTLFVVALVTNVCLATQPFYGYLLTLQALFYLLAALGWVLARRGVRVWGMLVPFYVVMLNAAALVGGIRYLLGRQSAVWAKVR